MDLLCFYFGINLCLLILILGLCVLEDFVERDAVHKALMSLLRQDVKGASFAYTQYWVVIFLVVEVMENVILSLICWRRRVDIL